MIGYEYEIKYSEIGDLRYPIEDLKTEIYVYTTRGAIEMTNKTKSIANAEVKNIGTKFVAERGCKK